ncbi:unnamed protein product, partial [Tetraodon nigroviridis]
MFYAAGLTVSWSVVLVIGLFGIMLPLLRRMRQRTSGTSRRVCVLVLGDIGRSPRMRYHSLSLSKHGFNVTFVGFVETKPPEDLLKEDKIKIVPIREMKGVKGPKILTYATKVVFQCLQLLSVLMRMELQSHILMQNPPGLPSISVAWFVSILRGSRLIIDWHNYGYSIMALSHGQGHPVVRLAERYEHFFGPLATHSLCVTNAMKADLQNNWGIRATTLYDRPASFFRETPLEVQHELFLKLANTHPQFQSSISELEEKNLEKTAFTVRDFTHDTVTRRPKRPALLISSTSWTEDEDFSVLLKALEGKRSGNCSLYIHEWSPIGLRVRRLRQRRSFTAIFSLCDHSGLDLPMKVVDMFGCCLPVCAIHFSCLHELVKHEENGLIFRDFQELAEQLKSLLSEFPSSESKLGMFRRNLRISRGQCWDDNWDQIVLPLIT